MSQFNIEETCHRDVREHINEELMIFVTSVADDISPGVNFTDMFFSSFYHRDPLL